MPITPYTAPLQYEYKPLNLMAFAAPLSKMQEEFDITTDAVESTSFDIEHLPYGTDKEKAKELLALVEGKRDELATNLAETKNYKQAATKLKRLNQLWKTDPEAVALKSNYALFNKLDEEEKKRVASGEITRDQYNQWKSSMIRDYESKGGASFKADYDNPQGTYNQIGRQGRLKDLEKELEELSWKVASNIHSKKADAFAAAGIDPTTLDAMFVQTLIEEIEPAEAAKKISAYLRTLPRFRAWGTEVATYDYEDLKANPEEYKKTASKLHDDFLKGIDSEILRVQNAAKKNPALLESPSYLKLLEYKQEASLSKQEGDQTGNYNDDFTKDLFIQDHLHGMYDMQTVGNVIGYRNVTRDYTFRDMPDEDGGGGSNILGGEEGMFMPGTEEKYSVDGVVKLIHKHGKGLWTNVKPINRLVEGNIGAAIMGDPKSKDYQKLLNDPSLVRARQVQLLEALTETVGKGKGWKEFQQEAASRGIQMGEGRARAIWSGLTKNGNQGISDYKSYLESSRNDNEQYVSATSTYRMINEGTVKSADYKKAIGEFANTPMDKLIAELPPPSRGMSATQAAQYDAQVTARRKQLWLFRKDKYTDAELKKIGLTKDRGYLTLEQVAKLQGYKSFDDAIDKGYDFGGIDTKEGFVDAHTQNVRKKVYELSLDRNEMNYRYVGNKQLDKEMSRYFLAAGDLTSYMPAYAKDWSTVPGFTEEGKLAPGTKLNISENRAPKLVVHGNQLLYEVPMVRVEDGKPIEYTVIMKPKEGMNVRHSTLLQQLDLSSSGESELDKQTNSMIKAARFDLAFPSNSVSPQYVQSISVTEGGTAAKVYSIPVDNGASLQIVKRWRDGAAFPVLMIAKVNNDGTSTYVNNPETGKPWYINADANEASYAAKNVIMQMMGNR